VDEQVTFLKTGIDGVFTDQADTGVLARAKYLDSLVGSHSG
jgi:glycerophosphoryl diester phosphodiesterase